MKKHFILAAMAMTALFCACSNDDSTPLNEGTVPVSFTIGGIDSRATTNTDYTTLFDNNDQIGISATNLTPAMNNVLYTVTVANSTTSIATTTGDYAYGTENAVFNAYYPYSEDFNNTFSIQTDQTSGIGASDFLTATATGSKENATVTLNFSHRLVLVEVNLTGVSNVSSVKLKNAKTEVTYTASTDGTTEPVVNTPDNSTKSDIIMNPVTASSKYWAIIPAQEITAGNLFEVTTSDGKTYLYTTTSASTFTAKKLVKYSLTLAEEAVLAQYNPVTIVAWDTQNLTAIEGNLEEKKFSLTNLYPSTDFQNLTGGLLKASSETETWVYQNVTMEKTTEQLNDATVNILKMTAPIKNIAWYNTGFAYYADKNNVLESGKTYTLTFDAKSNANNKFYVWIGQRHQTANCLFNIYEGTSTGVSTKVELTPSNQWKTYTITINPSKSATSCPATVAINNLASSDFIIAFVPSSTSTAATDDTEAIEVIHYFKNISIQEN